MPLPYLTASTLPYGSRTLNIDSVAYIAQSFRLDEPTTLIERTTELGAPNGAVLIEQARTGTATLQLATATTAYPQRGDEFTVDVDAVATTFFIQTVGRPEEAAGFKTVEITFRQKI